MGASSTAAEPAPISSSSNTSSIIDVEWVLEATPIMILLLLLVLGAGTDDDNAPTHFGILFFLASACPFCSTCIHDVCKIPSFVLWLAGAKDENSTTP